MTPWVDWVVKSSAQSNKNTFSERNKKTYLFLFIKKKNKKKTGKKKNTLSSASNYFLKANDYAWATACMRKFTLWYMYVRLAKTQINLHIHRVWSESSMSAWSIRSLTGAGKTDQNVRKCRLIWVIDRCSCHKVNYVTLWLSFVFSWFNPQMSSLLQVRAQLFETKA